VRRLPDKPAEQPEEILPLAPQTVKVQMKTNSRNKILQAADTTKLWRHADTKQQWTWCLR
jgi:hypothetical protein